MILEYYEIISPVYQECTKICLLNFYISALIYRGYRKERANLGVNFAEITSGLFETFSKVETVAY